MEGAAERTPRPKSPPEYAGLYGKRRHLTNLTLLEKEITSLQEELKSLDVIQPSSSCCQEVNEFVVSREDPLLATDQNHHKTKCCFTRCWGKSCFRPKGTSSCCSFSDEINKNTQTPRSSQRKQRNEQRRGGCCKLDSFMCCGNGNRECCTLPSVSCPQPNSCCCTSCATASCCTFKLCSSGCVGRSKCCTTCTHFTNCKCCCCC